MGHDGSRVDALLVRLKLSRGQDLVDDGTASAFFIEIGLRLERIRERRSYRATHGTFEAYCAERWGWTATRARQLIGSSKVATEMASVTQVTLPNEKAARALVSVPKKERASVLRKAGKAAKKPGKPTAKEIRIAAGAGRDGGESPEAAGLAAQGTSAANTPDAPAVCPTCGRP